MFHIDIIGIGIVATVEYIINLLYLFPAHRARSPARHGVRLCQGNDHHHGAGLPDPGTGSAPRPAMAAPIAVDAAHRHADELVSGNVR